MIQLSHPAPAISLLFATVESQSIHDYSSRWVLRTGLEREKLRDCQNGEKPLGLQLIFHQTKCWLGLLKFAFQKMYL